MSLFIDLRDQCSTPIEAVNAVFKTFTFLTHCQPMDGLQGLVFENGRATNYPPGVAQAC